MVKSRFRLARNFILAESSRYEIRNLGKPRDVTCYVRTTVHHDTLWRTDNLTLQTMGTLKTEQSKHKFKIKKQCQIFIASIAEQSLPAYQV